MLSELKIGELLNKCDEGQEEAEFAIAFARAIEAEVHKQYTELMRQMLEALETCKAFIDDAHIIDGQWHWLDDAKPAITAARARLGENR